MICVLLLFAGCVHADGGKDAGTSVPASVSMEESDPITESGNIAEIGDIAEENTDILEAESSTFEVVTDTSDEEIEGTASTAATGGSDLTEQDYEQNDAYKLFYGTWEITSIVSKHARIGADEGCEDILGMQVTLSA